MNLRNSDRKYSPKEKEDLLKKLAAITPERQRVARVFKEHIEKAIDELGPGYIIDLQGKFDTTPIRITVEILPPQRAENERVT